MERASLLTKRCVQCPNVAPNCPSSCPSGQVCTLVPSDCQTCARMTCALDPSASHSSSGPNVGAIAGGVVSGVAFVSLVVFFIWLFWIKKRRAQQDKELQEEWADEVAAQKRRSEFMIGPDGASTRTRASLATSMLSRASNFIQIAYIPGVTNRNGGRASIHSPVPPVPAAYRQGMATQPKSPLANEGDMLFFGIDDLRGSTYSTSTRQSNRYTTHSITPSLARDSVASDVQWDSGTGAAVPISSRGAPRVVSVKGSKADVPVLVAGQGNESIRGKATQISLPGKKGRFPVAPHAPVNPSPLAEEQRVSTGAATALVSNSSDDEDEHARARSSLLHDSPYLDAEDLISAASATRPNPYASMASSVNAAGGNMSRRGGSRSKIVAPLSAVLEEATRRASAKTDGEGEENPFADEHAL